MENRNRTESQTQLPEETIQHVQSFLSAKEAIRTSILSKSWYEAWLTRPNLDFAECDFPFPGFNQSSFAIFATKTIQRYKELNRKIWSFRLQMHAERFDDVWYKISLANKLIMQAMQLGATDLDIELTGNWDNFVLPREVLESKTLVRLSLYGGRIDHQKVSCSKLKSLTLTRVHIKGENLSEIISICPSIEKLVLRECDDDFGMLALKPTGFCVAYFHKLNVLWLENVEIGEWFFYDISRISCLKELTFHACIGYKEIKICSNSLRYISIIETWLSMLRITLDVPRIRKFKYSGSWIPSMSFKTGPREWTSEIKIWGMISGIKLKFSWFDKLRNFLLELSSSKISLSLSKFVNRMFLEEGCDYSKDVIIPSVEKLTLSMCTPSTFNHKILENLFLSCRPKVIALSWDNDFAKFLCNTLVEKVRDHNNQNMHALHDLVEVNVDLFEDDIIMGCRSLSWKTLVEASTNSEKVMNRTKVCLRLKWVESTIEANTKFDATEN